MEYKEATVFNVQMDAVRLRRIKRTILNGIDGSVRT